MVWDPPGSRLLVERKSDLIDSDIWPNLEKCVLETMLLRNNLVGIDVKNISTVRSRQASAAEEKM